MEHASEVGAGYCRQILHREPVERPAVGARRAHRLACSATTRASRACGRPGVTPLAREQARTPAQAGRTGDPARAWERLCVLVELGANDNARIALEAALSEVAAVGAGGQRLVATGIRAIVEADLLELLDEALGDASSAAYRCAELGELAGEVAEELGEQAAGLLGALLGQAGEPLRFADLDWHGAPPATPDTARVAEAGALGAWLAAWGQPARDALLVAARLRVLLRRFADERPI